MQDHLRALIAALSIALGAVVGSLAAAPAAAQTAPRQASLATEVPAGQFRGLRIRNVPRSARIAIAAKASARITLSLLNAADAARYPAPGEPLFSAPVESALSFAVVIPAAGDYVLMLDNTRGEVPSKVNLLVRAARGDAASAPPQNAPDGAVPPASVPPASNPPASVPPAPETDRPRLRSAPVPMHEM